MTTMTGTGDPTGIDMNGRIAVAVGAALLAAGLLLVTVVLPAEYGLDPLGTGRRLGLTAISDTAKNADAFAATLAADTSAARTPVVHQERDFHGETVEFTVAPGAFVEYKYRLDKGQALLYSWKTNSPVEYDFHAEPDGAPRGYAQSYEKDAALTEGRGTLTAPFAGIHGWYWKNRGREKVTVTLTSAGFYTLAHEFREGADTKTKTFN